MNLLCFDYKVSQPPALFYVLTFLIQRIEKLNKSLPPPEGLICGKLINEVLKHTSLWNYRMCSFILGFRNSSFLRVTSSSFLIYLKLPLT